MIKKRSFKVRPVFLPPEMVADYERLNECSYDPVGDAKQRGWVAFRRYLHWVEQGVPEEEAYQRAREVMSRHRPPRPRRRSGRAKLRVVSQ